MIKRWQLAVGWMLRLTVGMWIWGLDRVITVCVCGRWSLGNCWQIVDLIDANSARMVMGWIRLNMLPAVGKGHGWLISTNTRSVEWFQAHGQMCGTCVCSSIWSLVILIGQKSPKPKQATNIAGSVTTKNFLSVFRLWIFLKLSYNS